MRGTVVSDGRNLASATRRPRRVIGRPAAGPRPARRRAPTRRRTSSTLSRAAAGPAGGPGPAGPTVRQAPDHHGMAATESAAASPTVTVPGRAAGPDPGPKNAGGSAGHRRAGEGSKGGAVATLFKFHGIGIGRAHWLLEKKRQFHVLGFPRP